jgi:CBS domain-containing protein
MFSIYSIHGRSFSGSLDQWRQVARVSAPVNVAPLRASAAADQPTTSALDIALPPGAAAYRQAQQGDNRRQALVLAQQIMSAPALCLGESTSVADALRQLALHGHAQAPVLNAAGAPVGMLLRADLLPPLLGETDRRALLQQPVSERMRTPVPCASIAADIRGIAELLVDGGWPGLPVIDEAGQVIGFVARGDIVRAVATDPPLELWA